MSADYTGWIVRSEAGRDRGELFCVIGEDDERLLLADGKRRRVERPKPKKLGHITALARGEYDHPVIRQLREGTMPSNRELRKALAAFRHTDQGGNQAWQRAI